MLQTKQGAEDVGIEHRGIGFRGHIGCRARFALGARVVHGYVEPTEARNRPVNEIAHVVLVPNIRDNELCLGAQTPQLRLQSLSLRLLSTRNHQPGPFLREGDRGGAADAREAAGDQDNGSSHSRPGTATSIPSSPINCE